MAIIADDEILKLFLEESNDNMGTLEEDLLEIEESGGNFDDDLVNRVFRGIHSIKGGAGFLGLQKINELAHSMENVLDSIRNKELVPDSRIINVLLTATDQLAELIDNAVNSNDFDISYPVSLMTNLLSGESPPDPVVPVNNGKTRSFSNPVSDPTTVPPNIKMDEKSLMQARKGGKFIYRAEFGIPDNLNDDDKKPTVILKELSEISTILETNMDVKTVKDIAESDNGFVLFSTIADVDIIETFLGLPEDKILQLDETNHLISLMDIKNGLADGKKSTDIPQNISRPDKDKNVKEKNSASQKLSTRNISIKTNRANLRVNVKVLDTLMSLAGELVLTRNQLVQGVFDWDKLKAEQASQRVDILTSELQEAIMTTRMQPIGLVFNKFKRIVHDLARNLGKEIELEINGKDVDLDKTIIEAIADPMTHLIRNAVDHGIEYPDDRIQSGKPVPAKIKLDAHHEAGQVFITVQDDGAGINPESIRKKALELGWYTEKQLNEMSLDEIVKLILKPGFSLAREITDVSGRGVGMDVVNSNLTKLGGTIDIKTKIGVGTAVEVKLPLTLAIIPSLIVKVENEKLAIPQVNLVKLIRIPPDQVKTRIEHINDASVIRLMGELLPLMRLSEVIGVPRTYYNRDHDQMNQDRRQIIHDRRSVSPEFHETDTAEISHNLRTSGDRRKRPESAVNIIVVNAGEINYGLIVDQLLDTEEIVVKPLGSHLQTCSAYAGATILGDGKAALILDVVGIAKMTRLRIVHDIARDKIITDIMDTRKNAQSLILVKNGPQEHFAVPLGLITRIEKVHVPDIESPGGQLSMKYRGSNIRLYRIEDTANVNPAENLEWMYVIIFIYSGREAGVLVSQIEDAIDISVEIDDKTFRQPGILGSAIIHGQTTMLLDLYGLVNQVEKEKSAQRAERLQSNKKKYDKQVTLLVVEDSEFFRNHIVSFLTNANYAVLEAKDGVQGVQLLEENQDRIQLILTDIEMPNMDGIEMTKLIRENDRFSHLPILACTSVAGEAAEKRGYAAGLDDYLIKLDREMILDKISYFLKHDRKNKNVIAGYAE